jgi:hypothetical protein
MPGQSIPGAIAGAFRTDKPDVRWSTIDPARQARLGSIWSEYDTSASPANNANYLAAYAANMPQAQNISKGNLGFLNQYATGAYDPTKSYGDILKMNQDALGSFLINPALADLTRQRKEQQARAGYGGQGGGTYDALLQGRIQQQLASQAVPNLLGSTNQAYQTAGQLGQENFLNRMNVIGSGEQYRQLDTPAMRYLEPTRLARSDVQANLGNLGAIATQEDKNRAYYRQPGLAERIGRGFNEVQGGIVSEANDALSLYERAYGSGFLGGAGVTGGGQPGSSGAGSWASAGSDLGKSRLAQQGGRGGGGGGGGGGNQQQIMQLIQMLMKMYGGGQGGGSSPYDGSAYGWGNYQPNSAQEDFNYQFGGGD